MRAPGSSLCHRPATLSAGQDFNGAIQARGQCERRHGPGDFHVWAMQTNRRLPKQFFFVDKCIEACERAANSNGFFILEHPEDLGVVDDEHPGSIWQWQEILELIPKCNACCFAIHQCRFGAITPKPTRLLTNLHVSDSRCHMSLPKFDRLGFLQRATATEMWPPSFTYVDWEDWH